MTRAMIRAMTRAKARSTQILGHLWSPPLTAGGMIAGAAMQSFVAATASSFISHPTDEDGDGKVGVAGCDK